MAREKINKILGSVFEFSSFDDHQLEEIAIEPVQVVDSLGAGDIFHGAFCFYYNLGESFLPALEKASRIAPKHTILDINSNPSDIS